MTKEFKFIQQAKYAPFLLAIIAGTSVFYFLYFFEAYGIQRGLSYSGHSHLVRSLSFGFLTFAYLLVFEVLIKPYFKLDSFKSTAIWYFLLILVGIQLIFLLFNFFWNWQELSLSAYLLICKEFPLMMIFPIGVYFLMTRKSRALANEESFLTFQSENGKDQLTIKLQDFLFANSADNYVSISHLSNRESKQHLIRKPLKVLEEEMKTQKNIVRIHRSYLVNTKNIEKIRQEKSKVFVEIAGKPIPVSKQFQEMVLQT